jgi:hypothetical protein
MSVFDQIIEISCLICIISNILVLQLCNPLSYILVIQYENSKSLFLSKYGNASNSTWHCACSLAHFTQKAFHGLKVRARP